MRLFVISVSPVREEAVRAVDKFGLRERSGARFANARQDRHDLDNGVNDPAEDSAAFHGAEFGGANRLELWMVHRFVSLDSGMFESRYASGLTKRELATMRTFARRPRTVDCLDRSLDG
jgi:hypothetical protein